MTRLVLTELTRLRWRRAVVVLVAACVLLPLLIGLGTVWDTRPYSPADLAEGRAQAASQPGFAEEVRACEARPRQFGVSSADDCEELVLSWYTGLYREPLAIQDQLGGSGVGVAGVLLVLLTLVGTTFVGADWGSGSMSNQLLFEPRRLRVWLAKALAVGTVAAVVAAVVQLLVWGGLGAVAATRGLDTPAAVWGEVAWMVARCTFLAALGALVGYALTQLSRSTVFTLGVLFAVSAVSTVLVAALPLGVDRERWLPPTNVLAVMRGQHAYYREPPVACQTGDPSTWDAAMRRTCEGQSLVTVWDGLLFLLVPTLVVVTASVWSFRRRDVP